LKHGHDACVEGGMISRKRPAKTVLEFLAIACAMLATALRGSDEVTITRDTLVYKDGDRVQGALVTRQNDVIVFKSDRFGELRVPAADAVVIMAEKLEKPTPTVVAQGVMPTTAETKAAADQAEVARVTIWDRFSPALLTAKLRNYFGPWHGRLSFSTEVVSDVAERNSVALEGTLKRKWEKDEVELSARYDSAETNDIVTTDMLKGSGSWRHEFTKKQFAHYRPSVEVNHASKRAGMPNDYVLLQQEIGVGYHLLTTPSRKVRVGVSQNFFDLWATAPLEEHTSRGVQSAFEEVEVKLPWQMGLTQRGVWYPVSGRTDGWENRVELNKKLTETLSAAVRHEIRRNNPDGSSLDYTRLKLLFGLDF
jgi:hypothetical protein